MALLNTGAIITDIRGRVNGHSFSRNGFGHTIQTKVIHHRKSSSKQQRQRELVKYITQSWLNLTIAEQNTWDPFASNFSFRNKFNAPVPSPKNVVYNITNQNYFNANGSLLTNAPVYDNYQSGSIFPTAHSVSAQTMKFSAFSPPVFTCLQIGISPPFVNGQQNKFKSKISIYYPLTPVIGSPQIIDLSSLWWSQYPFATPDNLVWFSFRWVNANSWVGSPTLYGTYFLLP